MKATTQLACRKGHSQKNAEELIIYKIFRHWTSKFNRNELSHEIFQIFSGSCNSQPSSGISKALLVVLGSKIKYQP